jgi:hypothetical protein
MMKRRIFALIAGATLLSACSTLKPVGREYDLMRTFSNSVNLHEYGNGKILIYNGARMAHKVDDTARLNLWIHGKPVGQLNSGHYVVLFLMPDTYEFKLQHKDGVKMTSVHTVVVGSDTKVINIKPTITSNKVEITNEIPDNFQYFWNVGNYN